VLWKVEPAGHIEKAQHPDGGVDQKLIYYPQVVSKTCLIRSASPAL
jgi:hypothetical protein